MIVLDLVVGGEEGKKWLRDKHPDNSNYPMVCRKKKCDTPLGILHTDNFTERAYFEEGVSRRGNPDSVTCPNCKTKHDLLQYWEVGDSFDGTDKIPTEARVTLEEMPILLRNGIKEFSRDMKTSSKKTG